VVFLSVSSVFIAFGIAGALSAPIAFKWKPGPVVHVLGSVAAMTLYYLLVHLLPFRGPVTELPIVLAAGLAWSGPVAAIHLLNQQQRTRLSKGEAPKAITWTPARMGLLIVFGLIMPLMAGVMMTLTSRMNHALWLGWQFDGTVTAKTRNKSNHNLPVISVDGVTYEAVDEHFWDLAQVGQKAVKKPGSSFATLDGQRVRMLQRDMGWDE
jgi:hypothetical protein